MRSRRKLQILLSNAFSFMVIKTFRKNFYDCNNILYVNSEKLGDLVLCSDFLISQKQNTNFGKYFLALQEEYTDLFDWEKAGIIPVPFNKHKYRWNIFYRIDFLRKIRTLGIKKAVNITPERGMIDEEIILSSGAEIKTALKSNSLFLNKRILKRNNEHYSEIYESVEINEYKRLLSYSGFEFTPEEILNYKPFNSINGEYILVAPMASEMDRTLGLEKYRELLKELCGQVFLLGSGMEKPLLDSIIPDGMNVTNLAGKTDIPQTTWLIKNSRLFIGNDSGLSHIALNTGTPLVAITGGGKVNMFFPYKERSDAFYIYNKMDCFGCSWFCIHEKMECLTKIEVGDILNAADKLLKKALV